MYKVDILDSPVFTSDTGETVVELVGPNANGSQGYSLAQVSIAPGGESKPHYHPVVEETYYILEGEGYMQIDEERIDVKKGDTIVVPALASHQILNPTDESLNFLVVCCPEWTPECSEYL